MLAVISPAKRLDWAERNVEQTEPAMQDDAIRLAKTARNLTLGKLKALMDLSDDLARLTWPDGSPLFVVRDASQREQSRGTDFEAFVLDRRVQSADDPETRVLLDGEPIDDLVEQVGRISGTHDEHTDGIVIATGPDLDPTADPSGLSIFDITPTLLYGLGLPVAEDFAGTPRVDLFTDAFRAGHPLRTIASWGSMDEPTDAERSSVDQELVDELRALGYIE